jgi:hypothetical protein
LGDLLTLVLITGLRRVLPLSRPAGLVLTRCGARLVGGGALLPFAFCLWLLALPHALPNHPATQYLSALPCLSTTPNYLSLSFLSSSQKSATDKGNPATHPLPHYPPFIKQISSAAASSSSATFINSLPVFYCCVLVWRLPAFLLILSNPPHTPCSTFIPLNPSHCSRRRISRHLEFLPPRLGTFSNDTSIWSVSPTPPARPVALPAW